MPAQSLWQPTLQQINDTLLTRFMAMVQDRYGLDFNNDYNEFYSWSIHTLEDFWNSFWDFAGVKASVKGTTVLAKNDVFYKNQFFPNARLNYAENILATQFAKAGGTTAPAIIAVNEHQQQRIVSFEELYEAVARVAVYLRQQGVSEGDRVAGLLPNVPEAIIAALATASLGAVWVSCSPEFGEQGILDRFSQVQPKILFVTDGYAYKNKVFNNTAKITALLQNLPTVKQTVMIYYMGIESKPMPSVINYDTIMATDFLTPLMFVQVPFNHPLYIVFSSGTTGVPKCIIHSHGGVLLQHMKEHQLHCDLKPGDRLMYYTTTSWMMWNWLLSGLASQATLILYDGSPFYPKTDALFDLVDDLTITHLGVSAKYLDALHKDNVKPKQTHKLNSLKMILSTGSPLAVEGFHYVYNDIASDICLASISGGTDILSCFALGNPIIPVWAGELPTRGLGMAVEVYNEHGQSVQQQKGELVCTQPFPAMPVGFWNDPDDEKFRKAYFEFYPNVWHHGDYVELTEHNGLIIHGRSDTVLNPGGVRIGTAEIYRQVEKIDVVQESLAVGQQWQGDERIILFIILKQDVTLTKELQALICQVIRDNTTIRHVPAKIICVKDFPRTANGKMAERAVKDMIHGRPIHNQNALMNPDILVSFSNFEDLKS